MYPQAVNMAWSYAIFVKTVLIHVLHYSTNPIKKQAKHTPKLINHHGSQWVQMGTPLQWFKPKPQRKGIGFFPLVPTQE